MGRSQTQTQALREAIGYLIRGDVPGALGHLRRLPRPTRREAAFARRLYERFYAENPRIPIPTHDPWVRRVVRAYQRYLIDVLTRRMTPEDGERALAGALAALVREPGGATGGAAMGATAAPVEGAPRGAGPPDLDAIEGALAESFAQRGYHFLGGVTPPFRGPYVWRTQEKAEYDVEIPGGTERLTVYFMDDFLMLGWLEFASLGFAKAGGWAKEDGLYCVRERYEAVLDQPAFTVSYLKHEAQHIADYRAFPDLAPKDLEYRAKLVELIYYPSKEKFHDFLLQADDDPANAHAHAAHRIVSGLSERILGSEPVFDPATWVEVTNERIQEEARNLFDEHTEALRESERDTNPRRE